ncbi:hypothetical protein [Streptomyces decoyicus]|uniref:hypothetical protein n=1 Tax=Streptomyces decoyicus TaxID=249567 RepID=UPI00366333A3
MFQSGTTLQYIAPHEDWGAYGTVSGYLGDSETYTVDLLAPRTGTAVWGHSRVVRVWEGAGAEPGPAAIHPGGTIPLPGLCLLPGRRRPLPHPVVGSLAEAQAVADWRPECSPDGDPPGWTMVGEGAHRAVILAPSRTTVYKIELEAGRNRREHRTLRGLRDQGYAYAPPTTVWTVAGPMSETEVLAMPYLPNDGTESITPYPRAGVIDFNPGNITVNDSRYWLIDASGL